MKTIHKFELTVTNSQKIAVPETAEILSAQVQNGTICLWVRVDTDDAHHFRELRIYGTGHEIGCGNLKFIDTVQLSSGSLIFHVFEVL